MGLIKCPYRSGRRKLTPHQVTRESPMSSAFAGKNGRAEQKKDHSEPSWEEKLGGSFILETSGPGDCFG